MTSQNRGYRLGGVKQGIGLILGPALAMGVL